MLPIVLQCICPGKSMALISLCVGGSTAASRGVLKPSSRSFGKQELVTVDHALWVKPMMEYLWPKNGREE